MGAINVNGQTYDNLEEVVSDLEGGISDVAERRRLIDVAAKEHLDWHVRPSHLNPKYVSPLNPEKGMQKYYAEVEFLLRKRHLDTSSYEKKISGFNEGRLATREASYNALIDAQKAQGAAYEARSYGQTLINGADSLKNATLSRGSKIADSIHHHTIERPKMIAKGFMKWGAIGTVAAVAGAYLLRKGGQASTEAALNDVAPETSPVSMGGNDDVLTMEAAMNNGKREVLGPNTAMVVGGASGASRAVPPAMNAGSFEDAGEAAQRLMKSGKGAAENYAVAP
jgi:hypothetical protein